MTVTVLGSGYVGVSTAAVAAQAGHKVFLIDVNPERINTLKKGRAFFYEEGIDQLLQRGVGEGKIIPTLDYSPGVAQSDLVISCVGTPENPDGSSNLEYVFAAARSASPLLKDGAIYIQKSTVPVGTGKKVLELLPSHVSYVSNPEFLREAKAVYDTLHFDRIVAGSNNSSAIEKVFNFYKSIENNRKKISKISGITLADSSKGAYVATTLESAELIKVTANAFLALKISFANSIAKLADVSGADIVEVMDAVGSDSRIGRAFLDAGRGYGGGCFPKDVSGLIGSAADYGVDMSIMTAASEVNESMPGYIANRAQELLGALHGKKVAVLGLSFKAGTSDARKSPGVKLANILAKAGAEVRTYDPYANGDAKEELRKDISLKPSAHDALSDADAVFITTDWPEFINADLREFKKSMSGTLFYDAVNAFNHSRVVAVGLQYVGVGRS